MIERVLEESAKRGKAEKERDAALGLLRKLAEVQDLECSSYAKYYRYVNIAEQADALLKPAKGLPDGKK